jgi:hypothetical protein
MWMAARSPRLPRSSSCSWRRFSCEMAAGCHLELAVPRSFFMEAFDGKPIELTTTRNKRLWPAAPRAIEAPRLKRMLLAAINAALATMQAGKNG